MCLRAASAYEPRCDFEVFQPHIGALQGAPVQAERACDPVTHQLFVNDGKGSGRFCQVANSQSPIRIRESDFAEIINGHQLDDAVNVSVNI